MNSAVTIPSGVANAQRIDRLFRVVETSTVGGELLKRIYHLGTPRFCGTCRTAYIAVGPEGRVVFVFNPNFFDGLDAQQLIFVLLHESLHLALAHPRRRQERLPALWNIATDLVVNQFLLDRVGFSKNGSADWRAFISTAIIFENLGMADAASTHNMTAEEVYKLLEANLRKAQMAGTKLGACDEHPWCDGRAGDNTDEDGPGGNGEGLDGAADASDPDSVDNLLDEVGEILRGIFEEWMPSWSPNGSGELRQVLREDAPVIDWERILAGRIENSFQLGYEQRWSPPNRKIAWMFPRVLLPAEHELERRRTSVLLAVDASGSISPVTLGRFMALAQAIPPDRADVSAVVFDTVAHELEIYLPMDTVPGGGGTSFQCIEEYAAGLQEYPGLIVVLTDGRAPKPHVRHPDRWFWLVTEDGTCQSIAGVGMSCVIADPRR